MVEDIPAEGARLGRSVLFSPTPGRKDSLADDRCYLGRKASVPDVCAHHALVLVAHFVRSSPRPREEPVDGSCIEGSPNASLSEIVRAGRLPGLHGSFYYS